MNITYNINFLDIFSDFLENIFLGLMEFYCALFLDVKKLYPVVHCILE